MPSATPRPRAPRTDAARPRPAGEGRRDRKRRELRERVYEVARELFVKQGFAATTVEQIAEAADVAPATFFNQFQSKGAVLALMTGEVVEYVGALVAHHLGAEGSIGEQLEGLARDAAEQIAANHGVARDVVLELMRMESRPDDTAPYLARVHVPVAEMMRAGQRSGEIRTDCDADFLAEMVVGALNAAVTHWLADPDYPIADRLPRAAAFVWEAIRAPGAAR
ncbi:MAG: TetR/AcrR family transcriptional regulator [Myxococcota bacterium]|nr:helix-turn-helix transcriptional regulator [Myxococcales bacterium]